MALEAAAFQVMAFVVVVGMQSDPGAFLAFLARGLANGPSLPLVFAFFCFSAAFWGSRRVAPAVTGWHLHLPVDASQQRRAAVLALLLCQMPVGLLWLVLFLGAHVFLGGAEPVYLAALPAAVLAAAYATAPLSATWSRWLAGGLLLTSTLGSWLLLLLFPGLLIFVDLRGVAGHRTRPIHRRAWRSRRGLELRIAWRALRWHLVFAYSIPVIAIAATWIFLHNNELSRAGVQLGARFGCGLGTSLLLTRLASLWRVLRPPWGWLRSLPTSARERVWRDASLLILHGAPVALLSTWLAPATLPSLLLLLVYVGVRLAGALRRPGESLTTLGGAAISEVLLATLAIAVTPWSAILLLLLLPWTSRSAVRRERSLKVGLWQARHHLQVGDPAA